MPAFAVTINGRNFLIEMEGELKRLGFYTTREVEATDPSAAEAVAIRSVQENAGLREMVRNAADDPPMMSCEGVIPLETIDPSQPVPGLAFYDDDDWQAE